MASEWYYAKDGKQLGPIGSKELQDLALSRELASSDLVWKEGMPNWIPAGRIKGLIPPQAGDSPTVPPPLPPHVEIPTPSPTSYVDGIPQCSQSPSPSDSDLTTTHSGDASVDLPFAKGDLPHSATSIKDSVSGPTEPPNSLPEQLTITLRQRSNRLRQAIIQHVISQQPGLPEVEDIAVFQTEYADQQERLDHLTARILHIMNIEGSHSFSTEVQSCEAHIAEIKSQRTTLEKRLLDRLLASEAVSSQGAFGDLLRILRQTQIELEATSQVVRAITPSILTTLLGKRRRVVFGVTAGVALVGTLSFVVHPPLPSGQLVLPSVLVGRHLNVNVGTVRHANVDQGFVDITNGSLSSVKCVASEDEVVIDFDIDVSMWSGVNGRYSLMVRLFDKNGDYLTHFTTVEGFTVNIDEFNRYDEIHKRVGRYTADYKCVLLKPKGNRLVYEVNVRDLRDASIVEIGFTRR